MPKGKSKHDGKKGGKHKGRKAPFDYLQPLKPKQLRREVRSTVRGEIRPLKSQIKGEQRASAKRVGEIKDYFEGPRGYLSTVDTARAATDAKYNETLAKIAAQTGSTAAADAALRATLDAEAQKDAATRGATYDPSESNTAAQAALSRRSAADTTYGTVAGQGAAQFAYLTDKGVIGKGEEGRQISDERARGRSYAADRRELAREAGDLRTEVRGNLLTRERELALQNRAFSQPSASAKSQKQLARLYGKNTKREQNRSLRNQLAVNAAQGRNEAADDARSRQYLKKQEGAYGGGGNKGVSHTQVRQAIADLRRAPKSAQKTIGTSTKNAVDYLASDRGFGLRTARKAARKAKRGGKPARPGGPGPSFG